MDSKYPYETICEESEDEWVSMNVIVWERKWKVKVDFIVTS